LAVDAALDPMKKTWPTYRPPVRIEPSDSMQINSTNDLKVFKRVAVMNDNPQPLSREPPAPVLYEQAASSVPRQYLVLIRIDASALTALLMLLAILPRFF